MENEIPPPQDAGQMEGKLLLPVVGNALEGSEEHKAKPESKVLPPQWKDSTE